MPGGPAIPSGSVVNCTGTDTAGVGDGTQNNVSVTVQSGASIAVGDNAFDIHLQNNNVVTNNGTLSAGDNSFAIFVISGNSVTNNGSIVVGNASMGILTSSNSLVVNTGSISVQSGFGIQAAGLDNPIINSGNITIATGGTGLSSNGGGISPITNSGAITFLGGTGTGIFLGAGGFVNNSGAITLGGGGAGITTAVANTNLTNSGAINIAGTGTGLRASNANSTINNSGAITIGGDNSLGIQTFAAGSAISNSATITLTGNNGIGIQTAGANSGVVNSGAITVTGGPAISTNSASSDVTNSGSVNVNGNATFAIFAPGAQVINSGTVTTTASIALFGNKVQNTGTVNDLTGIGIETVLAGASVVNSGVVHAALALSVSGGTSTVSNTGLLDGPVEIIGAGNVFTNSGVITITTASVPVGRTDIVVGTFTQSATGVLGLRVTNGGIRDSMLVDGTANLGGTLGAVLQPGLYANSTTYAGAIRPLTAFTGSFAQTLPFAAGTTTPLVFFTVTPTYNANSVDLTLNRIPFGSVAGETQNQRNVGSSLEAGYSTTLTGAAANSYSTLLQSTSLGALTQLSGETATAAQQTTFQAMGQFMGLLTDPFMGRGGGVNGATSAPGYADEEGASAYAAQKRLGAERTAYAMFTKAPLAKVYEPRWSVWAAGYGGSQSTGGNAIVGSNDTTSRIAGTAVGADYLFSPNTVAGFALAGGGTSFGVNNLGSGRSDLFQAGAYVRHTNGAAYITGALAYGWQDIITSRTVTIAGLDQLRAEFNANAYSGRVEGGYRFVAPWVGGIGITPYAAGQFTTFDLPAYAESVVSGTPAFALAYAAKSVTDARSEFGIRTDKSFAVQDGILALRGRVAWAHDFDPDRAIAATFQALPGASFVVNGAAQASDSALTTASAEMTWMNGWSVAGTFEGEFSSVTRSYGGKAVVRYAW